MPLGPSRQYQYSPAAATPSLVRPKRHAAAHVEYPRLSERDLSAERGLLAAVFYRCCLLTAIVCLTLLTGCGYVVGPAFPRDIRTIAVPVFKSNSFRRDIELQLTEAVHKEVQNRTPFRLVNDGPEADSRLTGRIVEIRKDVLGESRQDDARELQLSLAVELIWEDRRNGRVIAQQRVSVPTELVQLQAQAEFAPEVGQSLATATQAATGRLATRIVDMMETAW